MARNDALTIREAAEVAGIGEHAETIEAYQARLAEPDADARSTA